MSEMKGPSWLRALDIALGLIAITLSAVVLVYQELARARDEKVDYDGVY